MRLKIVVLRGNKASRGSSFRYDDDKLLHPLVTGHGAIPTEGQDRIVLI